MNNFQRIQQEYEVQYKELGLSHKKGVESTLSSFRFIASIIEVYLPKVADLLIAFMGGDDAADKKNKPPKSTPPNLQDLENRR